jgi:lipopolysaccharide export system ATP-binding protein
MKSNLNNLRSIDSTTAGLQVKNLRKSYKSKLILRDINLILHRGEVVALLGPNGAGKTTCFYTIAGLLPNDSGSINIDGQDITGLPMYRRAQLGLGYLPQEASIFRGLTVEGNLNAVLEISIKDKTERREKLDSLLAEFSIAHLKQASALSLSGGERRRVEIARCLAIKPRYVLLDEPFAGVDPIAVGEIRSLVSHLKKRDIGILITDHNVRETLEIVDRAYILHDGNVLMKGSPNEVINDKTVRRIYLGDNFQK